MRSVSVITAIYDGYDTLKPAMPQEGIDVDWVCVTDTVPSKVDTFLGWRIVYEPLPGVHPNRAAKHPKTHPWRYTDAPASVWLDASFQATSPTFVRDALSYAGPLAQFSHPWRDCLYDEVEASRGLSKYAGQPLLEQARAYRDSGHPEHWGLWAAGVIARFHTPAVQSFGDLWKSQIDLWSFQDQVSEPFALRLLGLRPVDLPGTHFANNWLQYAGSGRH